MRVLPIIFNTDMVRAILDGRKTVTRRKIEIDIVNFCDKETDGTLLEYQNEHGDFIDPVELCRYQQGDILYVRETWFYEMHMEDRTAGAPDLPSGRYSHRYIYRADSPDYPVDIGVGATGWRPSIHMPKEAARIFLKVKDVRVEQLQDMDRLDAINEGINTQFARGTSGEYLFDDNPLDDFIDLWDSTIKKSDLAKYGWDVNPYVWVIEFERCEKPEIRI